jgi:hypothetical protein
MRLGLEHDGGAVCREREQEEANEYRACACCYALTRNFRDTNPEEKDPDNISAITLPSETYNFSPSHSLLSLMSEAGTCRPRAVDGNRRATGVRASCKPAIRAPPTPRTWSRPIDQTRYLRSSPQRLLRSAPLVSSFSPSRSLSPHQFPSSSCKQGDE